MDGEIWIEERYKDFYGMRYRVDEVLFCKRSPYQEVIVVNTRGHGRVLFNDGLVMVSERDERAYHEMMTHVPLFCHPSPKRVLIIGGGDGGTAREVLRHPEVKQVVLVEIDEVVVEAAKAHLPSMSCSYSDPRLRLLLQDAVEYVKETDEQFDVVLVDSTDPVGPAQPLFGEAFYTDLAKILGPQGIVVAQAESPYFENEMQGKLRDIMQQVFGAASLYNYSNLTYPGGLWSFAVTSRGVDAPGGFSQKRYQEFCKNFDGEVEAFFYYNERIHYAAFALPTFMRRAG